VSLILLSCRERIEPEADDYVEYGWTLYADRNFRGALEIFQEGLSVDSLYIDGYSGSGWCYVEFNEPDSAIQFFNRGLDFITVDSSQVRFDMLAGIALSFHAIGNYEEAVDKGTELYTFRPLFEFAHDWRIDYVDIVLLVALSHYAQGDFVESLTWVQILDEDFTADVSTNEGRAELIDKIGDLQNLQITLE
jgi:tetratricopeptide (TPR) repeat protein